jgi:hypothetical protein
MPRAGANPRGCPGTSILIHSGRLILIDRVTREGNGFARGANEIYAADWMSWTRGTPNDEQSPGSAECGGRVGEFSSEVGESDRTVGELSVFHRT